MTLLLRAGFGACLLVGVLLTGLRVLQPGHGLPARLVSFTPFGLPAHLLALLLLAALVLLPRVSRLRRAGPGRPPGRRTAAALAALPVAGVVLHAGWLLPLHVADGAEPDAESLPLTVMTVNLLKGEADPEEVVRLAAQEDVDLLAVQEVTPYSLLLMEEAGLNVQLPFHAGEAIYGVEGTMLFSRHPLAAERDVPTQWTSFRVRVDVEAAPATPEAPEPVHVVVTHPESPMGDASGWRADHAVLRDAVAADPPDLVLGDLNATPDHRMLHDLLDLGLRDAAEAAGSGWQPTWPAPGAVGRGPLSVPPVITIDHVLTGSGWAATGTRTHWVPGTDHAALVAEVFRR
ncbi:endonuclease/exonuclease/phosphatase family protein [Nocardioides solisilvae]|uniref:endonuclease/exonuclease/phosphatase family protein n=1 Tax=Nocardioides solisilvae TaxID=1542435 RepID=UPI000D748372|nr:endonuclease/exonuclease/phosphatase family protein [Nocardioides solisilvae]